MPIKNFRRCFDAKEVLGKLEKLLVNKKKKPTGFSQWSLPDLGWMLRVIIAFKPDEESAIVNFRKVKMNFQEEMLF